MFGVSSNSTANYYTDPVTGDYVPYYAYTPYKDYLRFFSEMEEKGYIRKLPQGLALLDVISLGMNGYNNIWDPDRVLGNDGSNFPPGSILLKSDRTQLSLSPFHKVNMGIPTKCQYGMEIL